MAKTKFTRENVSSSILKKVIIRVDYQGFSGVDDTDKFITNLKTVWGEYFQKYVITQNRNFNINFGKEGMTNFDTEIIRIHRFSDCRIGTSQALMDITGKFASIDVTCISPYEGSDGYLDCMARYIKLLKDYDPFVELTRIGIRKFDYIFKPTASELDNILETNVWRIYQDIPHLIPEKKEYKDYIPVNFGMSKMHNKKENKFSRTFIDIKDIKNNEFNENYQKNDKSLKNKIASNSQQKSYQEN